MEVQQQWQRTYQTGCSGLELLDAIASESKLSEEDAIALGRKVKKSMWERVYKKPV